MGANLTGKDMKVTIQEIAQKANVSPSTVSRVLQGTVGVSQIKHQAVMDAVRELDYRPNIFAQSLASGKSMTIGVLTQNFGSPFYDGLLRGILEGFEETNYWPLFADGRWQVLIEQRALAMLLERQVDGIIVLGGQTPEETLREIAMKKPLDVVARKLTTMTEHNIYAVRLYADWVQSKRKILHKYKQNHLWQEHHQLKIPRCHQLNLYPRL